MATDKERRAFTKTLMEHVPGTAAMTTDRAAYLLLRHGTTHKRLQEMACTVEMTEGQERRHEAQDTACEERITAICTAVGITPIFSGDPRGHTVKLTLPDGYVDDWGLTGFCVPTS